MKVLYATLILLLISFYKAQDILSCQDMQNPVGPKDCIYLPIPKSYYKCCYIRQQFYVGYEFENKTGCYPYSRSQYENLAKVVQSQKGFIKSQAGIIDYYDVDCPSNYLYLSLLSLIIFLL